MTDLSLLLLVLVLIEAFVIIRFELRLEQATYGIRERTARLETLTECRARRECPNCEARS